MVDEKDGSFHKEKFTQVLHYIIHQCGNLENVGKTVIFKLLYFSDFNFYELFERSITGESYRKITHGPAPCNFDAAIETLEKEGKIISIDSKYGGYQQKKYICVQKPSLDLLSAEEARIIDMVLAMCSSMTATQISALSHNDMPFKATEEGEVINYEKVFYRDELLSVRENHERN